MNRAFHVTPRLSVRSIESPNSRAKSPRLRKSAYQILYRSLSLTSAHRREDTARQLAAAHAEIDRLRTEQHTLARATRSAESKAARLTDDNARLLLALDTLRAAYAGSNTGSAPLHALSALDTVLLGRASPDAARSRVRTPDRARQVSPERVSQAESKTNHGVDDGAAPEPSGGAPAADTALSAPAVTHQHTCRIDVVLLEATKLEAIASEICRLREVHKQRLDAANKQVVSLTLARDLAQEDANREASLVPPLGATLELLINFAA